MMVCDEHRPVEQSQHARDFELQRRIEQLERKVEHLERALQFKIRKKRLEHQTKLLNANKNTLH